MTLLLTLSKAAFFTLQIVVFSMIIGLSLGGLLGLLNAKKLKTKWGSFFISGYVSFIRGTPLFVQLLFVYFALPGLMQINLSPIVAGVFTLGLNSSAYVSEIVRAGMDSVAEGQWEASYALGYSTPMSLRHIIVPQAIKNIMPALTNEMTALVKESSALMMIGVPELTKAGRDIVANQLNPMTIYPLVGLFYFIITKGFTLLSKKLEVKG